MLEAAARLFGARRFHEVRMDDIAAEADVSKGTLYRYFKDKEELYTALLGRESKKLVAQMRHAVSRTEGARQRLEALVATFIADFEAAPHLFDLIQLAEARRIAGGAFPWQQVRDEGLRLVLQVFREAQESRDFTVHDPHQAALMLLGGLRAVIRIGKRPRPRDLAQRIVDDFLHGASSASDQRSLGSKDTFRLLGTAKKSAPIRAR